MSTFIRKCIILLLLFICTVLSAENILPPTASGKFGVWSNYIESKNAAEFMQYTPDGGVDRRGALKVDIARHGLISIDGLRLIPGRKYRFGAFIRTKNLHAKDCRFVIHNHGWTKDIRTGYLPPDTRGKWVKIAEIKTVPVSADGKYTFSLRAAGAAPGSELEISAPFVEPVLEAHEESSVMENILDRQPSAGGYGIWSSWIAKRKIPVQYSPEGGVNKSCSVKTDLSRHRLAIENIKLETGKIYRFGAFVRTSKLKKGNAYLLVYNHKWQKDVRSLPLPADTRGQWVRVEFNAMLPESADGKYVFNLYGAKVDPECSVEISSPYIEELKIKKTPAPGGNLIPGFEPTADGEFGLWSDNIGRHNVKMEKLPGAGVDRSDVLRATGAIRLTGLNLIAGEKYRVSAYFRTNGGISEESRMLIYNSGWRAEALIGSIPVNTNGKWVKVENVVTAPPCRYGVYALAFYLPAGGTIDICKISLEGVSPRAVAETFPPKSFLKNMRRIYPVTPLLTLVEAEKPQITFSFSCPLPGKLQDHFCRMRLAGKDGRFHEWHRFEIPADKRIRTSAPAMAPGAGKLEVEIVRKSDNKTILTNSYDVDFIAPLPPFAEKRLNNIVTELIDTQLVNGKQRFVNPRDGWIYIGLKNSGKNAVCTMNGKTIVRYRQGSDRLETMRYLPRGEHEFTVSGVTAADGRLIVRTVPEIMLFPLEVWEQGNKNDFRYGIDFFRKYLWPNINTHFLISSWTPETAWDHAVGAEVDDRGIRRIGSGGFGSTWRDLDKMRVNILDHRTTNTTAGRACDETEATADPIVLHTYSEAGWEFADWDKFFYLWMARTTCYLHYPLFHGPLFAGAGHIGKGHGKLSMETYVETTPDLPSLKEYYQLVPKHFEHALKSTPDAPQRMLLIMSGLIMNGAWNCNAYPQSDIKYAWDYFFHLIANTPEAQGLYGIGCYNIRYADEENARWLAQLLRHYAIEGNKEMLSPKFGIVYNTGAVTNGDFKDGVNGWEIIPAEAGSITHRTIKNYGFGQLKRRGLDRTNGDTVLQLTRSAKAPNKIRQTLKNLTPGKLYSFFYVSTDADKVEKKENGRSEFVLEADLEGAEILPELSYEFRSPPEYLNYNRLEVVTRKIVFRAKSPEVKVTFRDWQDDKTPGAPIGGRRLLNFIGVSVYFEE